MRLNCRIKKQYLDMITKGAKTTEYREMSEYWVRKIVDTDSYGSKDINDLIDDLINGKTKLKTRDITEICFWCNDQHPVYKVEDISIYRGHKLFAIKLGK